MTSSFPDDTYDCGPYNDRRETSDVDLSLPFDRRRRSRRRYDLYGYDEYYHRRRDARRTQAYDLMYELMQSGTSCARITSSAECEAAAAALGISPTTAHD